MDPGILICSTLTSKGFDFVVFPLRAPTEGPKIALALTTSWDVMGHS